MKQKESMKQDEPEKVRRQELQSLQVENLPKAPPKAGQGDLFDEEGGEQ